MADPSGTRQPTPDERLKYLWESKEYADCVVICGGDKWEVHKSIIGACVFFDKALKSGFKEHETNTFNLGDDFPYAVRCMLESLYGFQLAKSSAPWELLRICTIADKYFLPKLKEEASRLIQDKISTWRAETMSLPDMLKWLIEVFDYTDSSGQPFPSNVLQFCTRLPETLRREEYVDNVMEVFRRCPKLAYELFKHFTGDPCALPSFGADEALHEWPKRRRQRF